MNGLFLYPILGTVGVIGTVSVLAIKTSIMTSRKVGKLEGNKVDIEACHQTHIKQMEQQGEFHSLVKEALGRIDERTKNIENAVNNR